MFNKYYTNCRLYRTLPKLSGNVKLDLILDEEGQGHGRIVQAHLRPISSRIKYSPQIDEYMPNYTYQYHLREFYKKTKSQFHSHVIDPRLESDWPLVISADEMKDIKYIKNWDDTYWAGTQRMPYKLYNRTHEVLVPVWIEQGEGFRFVITLSQNGRELLKGLEVEISDDQITDDGSFHSEFCRMFMKYIRDIGMVEGNNNVLSIDLQNNQNFISGIQMSSGNYVVRENYNLSRNLIFRERPLLEANSLLTNAFSDSGMIVSQLINFNLCFDLNKLLPQADTVSGISPAGIEVKVDVYVRRKRNDVYDDESLELFWQGYPETSGDNGSPLQVMDIYTNHDYVPKPTTTKTYAIGNANNLNLTGDLRFNALAYLNDNRCSDIMHCNKITQPICHWAYSENSEDGLDLFNLYNSFGSVVLNSDGSISGEYNNGFGVTVDDTNEFDENTMNINWLSPVKIGDGDDIQDILNGPDKWITKKDDKRFLVDMSTLNNDIKWTNERERVFMGIMTTPQNVSYYDYKNAINSFMKAPGYVGILENRVSRYGEEDLPATRKDIISDFDKGYDWHKYSDIDNRWAVLDDMYIDQTGTYLSKGESLVVKNKNELKYKNGADAPENMDDRREYFKSNKTGRWENINNLVKIAGGTGFGSAGTDLALREHDNAHAMFICARTRRNPQDPKDDNKVQTFIILWEPFIKTIQTSASDHVYPGNRVPNFLTKAGATTAISKYLEKYRPWYEAFNYRAENGYTKPDGSHVDHTKVPGDNETGDKDDFIVPPTLPDIDIIETVHETLTRYDKPEIITFNNSVLPTKDLTLSARVGEVTYYKKTDTQSYVLRYSGKIRPALYAKKVIKTNKGYEYKPTYGRNFFYNKQIIFPFTAKVPGEFATYVASGINPKYPSVKYDPIKKVISAIHPHGDLLYDEPHDRLNGIMWDGSKDINMFDISYQDCFDMKSQALKIKSRIRNVEDEIKWKINKGIMSFKEHITNPTKYALWLMKDHYNNYVWDEFKWFDKSCASVLPKELNYVVRSDSNDKTVLEDIVLSAMTGAEIKNGYLIGKDNERLGKDRAGDLYEKEYVKSLYDIKYNLLSAEPLRKDNKILFTYKYEINATLK